MNKKKSWKKQILLPGLFLSLAAMGVLFLLQIRWMNNSLWSENMRYRREAIESINRIGRFTMDSLDLASLHGSDPLLSLNEWRLYSAYPDLIKGIIPMEKYPPKEHFDSFSGTDVIYLTGKSLPSTAFVLDGTILYEIILLGNLREYAGDYTFTLSYGELNTPSQDRIKTKLENPFNESVFSFYLPRVLDGEDKRILGNLLSFGPEGEAQKRGDPPGLLLPFLTINLNDSRGSELFTQRLKILNISLIVTLSLILLGSYSLLFRLYREEERQRKASQTFVASVSHELRTPIAVIKSASDNLTRGLIEGGKVLSYGSLIGQEAERLNRMVESILYYSRLEGAEGTARLLWEEVNVREFTREILSSLEITSPGGQFDKELDGAPEMVRIDREAYRMIVENLVLNGMIHGSTHPVRVRLESDFPTQWRLVVEDEGPGIPRKEQKSVFEPFFRGSLSVANQIKGSGLGLHLVRTAAKGMGGRISLESPYEFPAGVEKRGCRFQLILPVIRGAVL